MSFTYASRIHHLESLLTSAFVRTGIVDASVIATVLFLALVDITTFETIDLVLLESFLARAYRGTVHCGADLFAAAIMVPTRIGRSAGPIPQFVIRWTLAVEGPHGVDALVIAATVVDCTFVDIDAGLLVLRQLVARRTGAEVTADDVGAVMRALAISLETLVDIQTGRIVGMQVMPFVAGAHVAA